MAHLPTQLCTHFAIWTMLSFTLTGLVPFTAAASEVLQLSVAAEHEQRVASTGSGVAQAVGSRVMCVASCVSDDQCVGCSWDHTRGVCSLASGMYLGLEPATNTTAYLYRRYCKETVLGQEFSGRLSTTKNGRTCQRWDSDDPQIRSTFNQNPASYAGGVFPENYCRNPDGEPDGPWCYTTDPSVRWEYCDVPLCSEL